MQYEGAEETNYKILHNSTALLNLHEATKAHLYSQNILNASLRKGNVTQYFVYKEQCLRTRVQFQFCCPPQCFESLEHGFKYPPILIFRQYCMGF